MRYFGRMCVLCVFWAALAARAEPNAVERQDAARGSLAEFVELDLNTLLSLEVEGAARRPQLRLEAPQAVCVLTRREIRESGATNLAELLRHVPGVFVLQSSANNFTVGIRGLNGLLNRRILVLVDGRQTFERGFGLQPWWGFGIALNDIERVEIVRGPGSVVYGANAMSGVINIISRSSAANEGVEFDAWGSITALAEQQATARARVRAGGATALAYNWRSASRRTGLRLSASAARVPEWEGLDSPPINGLFQYNVRAALEHRSSEGRSLRVNLSHTDGERLSIQSTLTGHSPRRLRRQALIARYDEPTLFELPLALRLELSASRLAITQSAPNTIADGTVLTESITYYDSRALALFDLTLWDGRYVLTAGFEGTFYAVTDFFGKPSFLFGGFIVNNEVHLLDNALIVHAGARLELIRAERKGVATLYYETISPRLSLIWRITGSHSLRLSASSAFTTPSPLESFSAVGTQIAAPPAPRNYFVVGNPDLEPERLVAVELGYLGSPLPTLSLETTVFAQRLSNGVERVRRDVFPSFRVNSPALEQVGWEAGIQATPWVPLTLRTSYTLMYGRDAESGERSREWPTHLFNLAATWRRGATHLRADTNLVFDYVPTVTKRLDPDTIRSRVAFENERAAPAAYINLRVGRYLQDDRIEIGLSVRNLLGFFRPRDDLRAYPHPSFQPLGGAVMLSVKGERL
jgi:outer membrane receptor protein involved in Fe transport